MQAERVPARDRVVRCIMDMFWWKFLLGCNHGIGQSSDAIGEDKMAAVAPPVVVLELAGPATARRGLITSEILSGPVNVSLHLNSG